jgi:hypothetical protein
LLAVSQAAQLTVTMMSELVDALAAAPFGSVGWGAPLAASVQEWLSLGSETAQHLVRLQHDLGSGIADRLGSPGAEMTA